MHTLHLREDFYSTYHLFYLDDTFNFTICAVEHRAACLPRCRKLSSKEGLPCYLLQWKQSYRMFLVQLLPSTCHDSKLPVFLNLLTAIVMWRVPGASRPKCGSTTDPLSLVSLEGKKLLGMTHGWREKPTEILLPTFGQLVGQKNWKCFGTTSSR